MELIEIARLEESRVATGIAEIADHSQPYCGGMMCRGNPGGWMNAAFGAGLNGPLAPGEFDRFIHFYEDHAIEPRVEICPFADLSLIRTLADANFVVRAFENVFFRELRKNEQFRALHEAPAGLRVEAVDPSDAAAVDEYARISLSGFVPADYVLPEELLETSRRAARHPRITAVRAILDGRCVGAGAIEFAGPIAALLGVTVLEPYRRRGVQQAMMVWRLAEAAKRGAMLATVSTRPGIATERNAMRMGFQVAYTKTALVRPGPGLTPNID